MKVNIKGVAPFSTYSTNKWGLRGDDPPSNWEEYFTICCIGGSTTICFYLDDKKTWPYLLQEKIKDITNNKRIWVGNGGIVGQTTRAHIIFMKKVVSKIRPDVIILLIGINDLGFSLAEDKRLFGNKYDKASWKYKIFGISRLIQILYTWKLILLDGVTVEKRNVHDGYQPEPISEKSILLPEDLRDLLPSLNEYRKNIKEIIKIGKSMNVRMVFLTQPMLFEDTVYWKGVKGYLYWMKNYKKTLSAATTWNLLKICNKELLSICETESVECYDLASTIPHSDQFFYDPVHFNENGAKLVAEEVSEFLKNNFFQEN
jgi:lysophospholipase L1-like esterase